MLCSAVEFVLTRLRCCRSHIKIRFILVPASTFSANYVIFSGNACLCASPPKPSNPSVHCTLPLNQHCVVVCRTPICRISASIRPSYTLHRPSSSAARCPSAARPSPHQRHPHIGAITTSDKKLPLALPPLGTTTMTNQSPEIHSPSAHPQRPKGELLLPRSLCQDC